MSVLLFLTFLLFVAMVGLLADEWCALRSTGRLLQHAKFHEEATRETLYEAQRLLDALRARKVAAEQ